MPARGRRRARRRSPAARGRSRARACGPRAARARPPLAPAPARSATARPSRAGTPRGRTPPRRAARRRRADAAGAGRGRPRARPPRPAPRGPRGDPRIRHISARARVTSVDVARRAGVSQSTVSLVLSGKARGRISAPTEEAVRAAATELGYRPNVAARALRTGVARSVALVVPDITNPFFGRVLRGAQRAAQGAGYTVVLVDIGNDRAWEATSLQALLAGPADGLLLFEVELPPGATEHAIQIEMRPGKLPVVRLDV